MRTPPRHYGVPFLLALLASLLLPRPALAVPTELVASGFTAPTFVAAPAGGSRLFVVERAGFIRVLADGAVLPAPFLDLRRRVNTTGEGGLLGLAFAPDYAVSRALYVYYTASGASRVSRFRASEADPNVANPAEVVVLEVPQPPAFINHKGGTVAFGPDGMLYLGLGDGGGSGDPLEVAQNPSSLLGKMVRIDVAFAAFTDTYRVPADNPFVGNPAVRPEIWAFGLRNPLRFGFDRETGDLYVGDVGKNSRQEIDVEPAGDSGGRNYGWDVMDGSACFEAPDPGEPSCNAPTLTLPVHEYGQALGCSVTGGTVYRGSQPSLRGHYLFADFCSGRIWSFVWNGAGGLSGPVVDRTAELAPPAGHGSIGSIVGFGEDGAGELYIVDGGGELFRIVPVPAPACANGVDDDGDGRADFTGDDAGDPGCADEADASEIDAALPCDDGVDNDGDGFVDFRASLSGDPGCATPWWNENPRCQDGVDNDRSWGIDFDGGASRNGGVPIGEPDPECYAPWFPREGGGCGLGFELALVLPLLAQLRRRATHPAPPRA